MARANELLAQGDISGARIVLERAMEMGSAGASFAIAETYDPHVLSGWKTYGTRGDAAKAREFYAKAAAGGIEQAKDRLESLRE
jgi:TPR repeat protein